MSDPREDETMEVVQKTASQIQRMLDIDESVITKDQVEIAEEENNYLRSQIEELNDEVRRKERMLKVQKDSNDTLDTRLKMSVKKMGILDLKFKNYEHQITELAEPVDLNSFHDDKQSFL